MHYNTYHFDFSWATFFQATQYSSACSFVGTWPSTKKPPLVVAVVVVVVLAVPVFVSQHVRHRRGSCVFALDSTSAHIFPHILKRSVG